MGISSEFKKEIRKRFKENALRREINFEDECTAPHVFIIDFALLLFNKPYNITTGRDLIESYVLEEILWFLRKPHSHSVVCAFDSSKYVPNAKGPTQKKRDQNKKNYKPENKLVAELFGINEGPLEKEWSTFLKDRKIRAIVFEWVIEQLKKQLPKIIPTEKSVMIAKDGSVFEWVNDEYSNELLYDNGSCVMELANTVGEADFFGVFVEQSFNKLFCDNKKMFPTDVAEQNNKEKEKYINVLIGSIDQDSIPITLLGTPSRLTESGYIRNHIYVLLSNRKVTDPEELKTLKNINIRKDAKTQKEYAFIRDYFDANGCWRQLMYQYRKEMRYKTLSNPIENLAYIMFLDKSSDYSPGFDGIGALKMWEIFEEYYDTIGGPLVLCDPQQYYQNSKPFVYKLQYKALWRFLRLLQQIKIQSKLPKQTRYSVLLGYSELYDIATHHYPEKSFKRIPDEKKVLSIARNALWALHYYSNGHRGQNFIPDCLSKKKGESVWGYELVDNTKERSNVNTQYSNSVYWNATTDAYRKYVNEICDIYV